MIWIQMYKWPNRSDSTDKTNPITFSIKCY